MIQLIFKKLKKLNKKMMMILNPLIIISLYLEENQINQ